MKMIVGPNTVEIMKRKLIGIGITFNEGFVSMPLSAVPYYLNYLVRTRITQ